MTITRQALRVYATLEGLKPKSEADVIDALLPFTTPLLALLNGKPFSCELLIAGLKKLYGWTLSTDIAMVFQKRLEEHGFLLRPEGSPKILLVSIKEEENSKNEHYALELDEIVDAFQSFSQGLNDLLHQPKPYGDVLDMLVKFLVTLDLQIGGDGGNGADQEEVLAELAQENTALDQEQRYVCARFVEHISRTSPEIFEKLVKLASVGMLTEVVQDFVTPGQVGEPSTLTVVLDAPLALSALGVSGDLAKRDVTLTLNALRKIGCKVAVFDESCNEMERILKTTLGTDRQDRHGPTHNAIVRQEVAEDYVKVVRADPEKALKGIGVTILPISLASFPSKHVHFNDERYEAFYQSINWKQDSLDAVRHDAVAMTLIARLREGHKARDVFDNRHIFVTSNGRFVRVARRFALDEGIVEERHCPPVVLHSALATAAWLRTGFGAVSEIPMAHLLAYCERVLNVRKEVVDKARSVLQEFNPEKEEQFNLLLQDARSATKLMDFTFGDADQLSPDNITDMLAEMRRATVVEVTEEYDRRIADEKARSRADRKRLHVELASVKEASASSIAALERRIREREEQESRSQEQDEQEIDSILTAVNGATTAFQRACTVTVVFLALIAALNLTFGWFDAEADFRFLYVSGGVVSLYALVQHLVQWPKFGISTIADVFGRWLLHRRLEKSGLVRVFKPSQFVWKGGQVTLSKALSPED